MQADIQALFKGNITVADNLILQMDQNKEHAASNQNQTKEIFSDKWEDVSKNEKLKVALDFQYAWFLELYGFKDEETLKEYLKDKNTIIDTGCGLGYKAAMFARLAPHALVLGVDISDAVFIGAEKYKDVKNLFFFQGDIANTGLKNAVIDFTLCDQVIMHTESPEDTFKHLSDITSVNGEFACYVYSKKALPRELIDDYFRTETHRISNEAMWEFSAQLTELGKRLSELNVSFELSLIHI